MSDMIDMTGIKADWLRELRERHHRLAIWVARGSSERVICDVFGMNVQRLNLFLRDRAFRNLVAHYREQIEEGYASWERHKQARRRRSNFHIVRSEHE
jgi:hypothetical protein